MEAGEEAEAEEEKYAARCSSSYALLMSSSFSPPVLPSPAPPSASASAASSASSPSCFLLCYSIVSRDNSPLYFRCFDSSRSSPSQLTLILHSSLDLIEERISAASQAKSSVELFVGQLFAVEKYRVFGYLTNSKLKFLAAVAIESGSAAGAPLSALNDSIRSLFREVHGQVIGQLQNPFSSSSGIAASDFQNTKFDQLIDKAAAQFNSQTKK